MNPGWLWVEMKEPDVYDPPQPGEYFWLACSPKRRLFEYPGGPACGALSAADFETLGVGA